MKLKVQ